VEGAPSYVVVCGDLQREFVLRRHHSLLNKHNCTAAVLFLLCVRLVGQDAGFVFADFGGEFLDKFLDDGELVRVWSDDGDDVDF
jgi:hypothetical protein